MKKVLFVGLISVAAASFLAPSAARADEAHNEEADALFRNGVELMKADNCGEAVPEFIKSNALDASAATLLNLGTCYARLGRKATAWKTFQKAADAAQAEKDEALRERALQAMRTLGPTLTKVQIVAPKDATPLSLRLNGEPLKDYDGLPIPLDPGQSVIEAAAPGREPWRKTVNADERGATLVIEVPDLRALEPPITPLPPQPAPERRQDYRIPAAVVGGLGVVALGVGTAFGLSAHGSYQDSESNCIGTRCTEAGAADRHSAESKAAVSTILFGAGVVAVTTGLVLWLVSPATHTTTRSAAVSRAPAAPGLLFIASERR